MMNSFVDICPPSRSHFPCTIFVVDWGLDHNSDISRIRGFPIPPFLMNSLANLIAGLNLF